MKEQEYEMNTLRLTVNEKDEESRKRQSMLDAKLQELEHLRVQVSGENQVTVLQCYTITLLQYYTITLLHYYSITRSQ